MDPDEFLDLARALSGHDDLRGDAASRTIINRAYYAAHHSAMISLNNIGIYPLAGARYPENTRHELVIGALRDKNDHLADMLERLRELRVTADYFLKESIDRADPGRSLKMADTILSGLALVR